MHGALPPHAAGARRAGVVPLGQMGSAAWTKDGTCGGRVFNVQTGERQGFIAPERPFTNDLRGHFGSPLTDRRTIVMGLPSQRLEEPPERVIRCLPEVNNLRDLTLLTGRGALRGWSRPGGGRRRDRAEGG